MKKFTWENFSLEFIKKVVYNQNTSKEIIPTFETDDIDLLIPSMLAIADEPTAEFVTKYRWEIESYFLRHYPKLVIQITGASKKANPLSELNLLSSKPLTNALINAYIKALLEVGAGEYVAEIYSEFRKKRTVDLKSSTELTVSLYDFQKDATNSLKTHFVDNDYKSGLLVMPTGSGKTRTAVAFLLKEMTAQGYQIIWLTHRHLLIDQTAKTFFDNAPSIKSANQKKKQFKMVCVSGNHQTIKATEKDDDLMILSVQSACRSLEYLKSVLQKKVIIVVDEAHHTVAKSYRKTIDYIVKIRKDAKLLGLTATPIRGSDSESKYLMRLFEKNIIYSISMADLIKKGVLAEPIFEHIQTGQNIEAIINIDEKKYIKKWGDLPSSLVDRVAKSSERNSLIVDQYIKNKERYGKTIVFALNGYHAFTLAEEFKKNKIKCDFIYSNHNKENNANSIRKFKNNEIDVLININILTEGSDIPDIQTVFLTRPTTSDVLLLQMIGRGMRGSYAGGTKEAYIVDFCDKWETFNNWLNPQWLIDCQNDVDIFENEKGALVNKPNLIPWGMIKDVYESLDFVGGQLNSAMSIPYGWYSLWDGSEDVPLIVFKDQYECYEKLFSDKKILNKSGEPNILSLKKYYFDGFITPIKDRDLELFWYNINESQEKPEFFLFENREKIDPYIIAKDVEKMPGMFDYIANIYNENPMISDIYGSLEKYMTIITDIIIHKKNPPSVDSIVEFPTNLLPYVIDNPHDLIKLTNEVISEMFGGTFDGLREINWTTKPLTGYYGKCWNYGGEIIVNINIMLNSTMVDKEVIKYIIYHELLHRDNMSHNTAFRILEHKYPNYTELERFLDYKLANEYEFEW